MIVNFDLSQIHDDEEDIKRATELTTRCIVRFNDRSFHVVNSQETCTIDVRMIFMLNTIVSTSVRTIMFLAFLRIFHIIAFLFYTENVKCTTLPSILVCLETPCIGPVIFSPTLDLRRYVITM